MKIRFLLVAEGSSDENLIAHIETLLINCGAKEASGTMPDLTIFREKIGRSIKDKVDASIKLEPNVDVIFVHRDADNAGIEAREIEIINQTEHIKEKYTIIPMIPTKEMEAWLLLDEEQIKRAAENIHYAHPIKLPKPNTVEHINNPKQHLEDILVKISELNGRKLEKFKKQFPQKRALLAQNLDPEGPVCFVPSHAKLRQHIREYLDSFPL